MKKSVAITAVILSLCVVLLAVFCVIRGEKPEQTSLNGEAVLTAESLCAEAERKLNANSGICKISLGEDKITADSPGVTVTDNGVIITGSGIFSLSGKLDNGCVAVNSVKGNVVLILDGVTITNPDGNCIDVAEGNHIQIYAKSGTENIFTSGEEIEINTKNAASEDATGSAIYSKKDLSFAGDGSIYVNGYINNAIGTTDNLVMLSGNITASSVNKGLKGNDSVTVIDGKYDLTTSADGIHSDGTVEIAGGEITINAGDDGIHADSKVTVNAGKVTVTQSFEGIEANNVLINGGDVSVKSSDDGINANGGNTNMPMRTDKAESNAGNTAVPLLKIVGGSVYINAGGDGLDSNGDLIIDGGNVFVDGPVNNGNGALDSGSENGGSIVCNGGTVIAVGSAGMAEAFEYGSKQYSFSLNLKSSAKAKTEIEICNSDGTAVFSYTPAKVFQNIVFSSADLKVSEEYTVKTGEEENRITVEEYSETSKRNMMPGNRPPTDENGDMPTPPGGERPEKPNGERPEMPEGEMPEMPEGEMPDFPENGERPELPSGDFKPGEDGGRFHGGMNGNNEPPRKPEGEQDF